MKNRFCRKGLHLLYAVCMLSAIGLTYSCKDDYDLDEKMPPYLKGSIYNELVSNGNFTVTIRLIDDLNYADVLAKTGSKTLFVANDQAYEEFFKEGGNPWGVRSYDELTVAQKKHLLKNAMLDNAYVIEMMANVQSTGELGSSSYSSGHNMCLRQGSAAVPSDSIPYIHSLALPYSENVGSEEEEGDVKFGRFWDWYRSHKEGIYMVYGNTNYLMPHFLENNLKYRNITNDDIAFVLYGHKAPDYGNENRPYIYNARVIEQDVTCMNGYYNVLDRVPFAPGNMAQEIAANKKTQLFSRILDRFSVPVYDAGLTMNARTLYPDRTIDSVFVKRYFASRTQTGNGDMYRTDPVTNKVIENYPLLSFDPAWNAYKSPSATPEEDMAAMFVPTDDALAEYFINGAGRVLMDRYAREVPVTRANLAYNIDQVPISILNALVNNLMKPSFNETVPSKYLTIMNDARDQMFDYETYKTPEEYKSIIDECILANNGVIYVTNVVRAPADYASVIAPAIYSPNTRIVRTVVKADEDYIKGSSFDNAPLKQYFSTYLKAMQSNFSFFVPVDEGLAKYGYVDPASIAVNVERTFRYWSWSMNNKAKTAIPIDANAYKYNPKTCQQEGDSHLNTYNHLATTALGEGYGPCKRNLLIEMINQHILVHDNTTPDGVLNTKRHYFLSREGAPVYVKPGTNGGNGENLEVYGGLQMQIQNNKRIDDEYKYSCKVVEGGAYDQTKASNSYGNGRTYLIDRPMQPAMATVYQALASDPEYSIFRQLCVDYDDALLDSIGFKEIAEKEALESGKTEFRAEDWANAKALYRVFVRKKVGSTDYNIYSFKQYDEELGKDKDMDDYLVRFFNNYRYTVYAPTNAAMQKAINKKLPTWDSIREELESYYVHTSPTDSFIPAEKKEILRAKVTLLVNFLKYHFQTETIFVDDVDNSTADYESNCIDNVTKVYVPITVTVGKNSIKVKDASGHEQYVDTSNSGNYNVVVRDANFNGDPEKGIAACKFIKNSSFAVVHKVNDVLNFFNVGTGNYDAAIKSPSAARKFVKKYHLKK